MEGVRLSRKELIDRFGISNRLAVRIGALMAKDVLVTDTLLDMAGAGSAVERLLLSPGLMKQAELLDADALQALAEKAEAGDDPLTAVERDGVRIIALEEELLAEEGFAETAPEPGQALAAREADAAAPDILGTDEARDVFDSGEVARLKLDALTSSDSGRRISAIRRLRYAPLSAQEKGGVFLQVLLDPVSPVRAEAINALEALGFDRDGAQVLRDIFSGNEEERNIALDRLGALFGRIGDSEKQVMLAILVEALREFSDASSQRHILRILAEAADHVVKRPDVLEDVIREGVNRLQAAPGMLAIAVERLVLRLGELEPDATRAALLGELAGVRDASLRARLLDLAASCAMNDPQRRELADLILKEIAREELDEFGRQQIGHALARFGGVGIDALVDAVNRSDTRNRLRLLPLLDMACVDYSADAPRKRAAADAVLTALRGGDRTLRHAVAEMRLLRDAAVPDSARERAAANLVRDLDSVTNPDLMNVLSDALESLGPPALKPLLDIVRNETGPDADAAVRIVARITVLRAEWLEHPQAEARRLFKLLRRLTRGDRPLPGCLWALGVTASSGAIDEAASHDVEEFLRGKLGRMSCHSDLVDALGYLGAGPSVAFADRVAIAHVISGILGEHETADDEILRERATPRGPVYEFGPRAEFDAVALPAAVDAARRVCVSPHVTDALRRQLADRLIDVWQKVADWTVIWGPRSSEALAAALGVIGRDAPLDAAYRVRLAQALVRDVTRLSVLKSLAALSGAEDDIRDLDDVLIASAERMLSHWMDADIAIEERRIVLENLAAIAARPQLPENNRVRRLRRRMAGELMDCLRGGELWTRRPLEALRDAPGTPKNLRADIDAVIRDAFALAQRD